MRKILRFPVCSKQSKLETLKFPAFPRSSKKRDIKQINGADCGPNILKHAIFYKIGIDVPEWKLINLSCCDNKYGAPIKGMANAARKYGLRYELRENASISDLIRSIDEGNPVIIFIQAWDGGHYDAVTGYDDKENKIIYYDPYDGGKKKEIHYETLDKKWYGSDLYLRNHFGIFIKD